MQPPSEAATNCPHDNMPQLPEGREPVSTVAHQPSLDRISRYWSPEFQANIRKQTTDFTLPPVFGKSFTEQLAKAASRYSLTEFVDRMSQFLRMNEVPDLRGTRSRGDNRTLRICDLRDFNTPSFWFERALGQPTKKKIIRKSISCSSTTHLARTYSKDLPIAGKSSTIVKPKGDINGTVDDVGEDVGAPVLVSRPSLEDDPVPLTTTVPSIAREIEGCDTLGMSTIIVSRDQEQQALSQADDDDDESSDAKSTVSSSGESFHHSCSEASRRVAAGRGRPVSGIHSYREMSGMALCSGNGSPMTVADIREWIIQAFPENFRNHRGWEKNLGPAISACPHFKKESKAGGGAYYWSFRNAKVKRAYEKQYYDLFPHLFKRSSPVKQKVLPFRDDIRQGSKENHTEDVVTTTNHDVVESSDNIVLDDDDYFGAEDEQKPFRLPWDKPWVNFNAEPGMVKTEFSKFFPEFVESSSGQHTSFDAKKKIEEIQKRPSRKETFGKRLVFARAHRKDVHNELDGFPETSKPQLAQAEETTFWDSMNLPQNPIPMVYQGQLAFREGVLVSDSSFAK